MLPGASANGCDSTVSVNVSFFAPALGSVNSVICATDTFTLAGEAFHADRPSGDVVLPGASANGCDSMVSVSVSFFTPALGNVNPVICATDTFTLAGEAFHADRPSGNVVLPGASTNGCDSTVSVNVDFFAPALGSVAPVLCPGDTFRLGGEAFFAGRTAGEVVLPGAASTGCDSTVSVSLTFFAPAAAPLNPTICAADTFFLAGEAFHRDRPAGDVVLPNASANGCDSTVSVTLSFFPQLTGTFDTTICVGSSFVYGGVTFDGPVDDQLVTLPQPTASGCDSLVSVTVRERAVPNVTLSGDGIICADGQLAITLTYDGPAEANVVLSSNPGEVLSLVAGSTTVERPVDVGSVVTILSAEDGGPCPLTTGGSITVSETDLSVRIDVMSGDGVYAVSCAAGSDGAVMAVPGGGEAPYQFDWNTGDGEAMVEGLPSGDYSLIVTSGRGCTATAGVTLNEPDAMVLRAAALPATCLDPDPGLLLRDVTGGVGPYVYSIDGTDDFRTVGELPDTVAASIGTTVLRLEDSNGCLLEQAFEFAPPPTGSIRVSPDRAVIVRGDSVEITVLTDLNAAGYLLTPGPEELMTQPDFFVRPDSTTRYRVTAVDSAGCTASGEVLVVVDNFVPVYAPTAFSPNLDGQNDRFRVFGGRNVVSFTDFVIFDRWGNRVYDFPGPVGPQDQEWGWDGRMPDGRLRQSGVYVFGVRVNFVNGTSQVVKGDLTLVR